MSEQEMDLDLAIRLFDLVETFAEYEEGLLEVLKRVHSQKELDRAREVINEKKQYMIKNKTEFKAIIESRKREVKQRSAYDRFLHKAKMAEIEAKASMARSDTMARVRGAVPDMNIDDFVARTRFKTVDPEELERKSKEELGCPNTKCEDYGKNRGNFMNNAYTCMLCYHKLVSKSKFKDYNRAYWRRYDKQRKKKRVH